MVLYYNAPWWLAGGGAGVGCEGVEGNAVGGWDGQAAHQLLGRLPVVLLKGHRQGGHLLLQAGLTCMWSQH